MAASPNRSLFGFTNCRPGKALKFWHWRNQMAPVAFDTRTFPFELARPNQVLRTRASLYSQSLVSMPSPPVENLPEVPLDGFPESSIEKWEGASAARS